jgi:rhamnosyltransferase
MTSKVNNKIETSIIILTRNAGELFNRVLENVYSQEYEGFEVIIIDSASNDETLSIAKKYENKSITISTKDFGHGKTRNFGAKIARGKNVVFLTQDAVPSTKSWLSNLVKDLQDDSIAGVYGRQIAQNDAVPMEKFYYSQMYGNKKIVWNKNNIRHDEIIFSNSCSAIRKDFLLKYPFPENLLMSEDRDWALTLVNKGFKIVYQPYAIVNHSHNSSIQKVFQRYFDFGVSHRQIGYSKNKSSFTNKGLAFVKDEIIYLASTNQIAWIPKALLYNLSKFIGLMLGRNFLLFPTCVNSCLSGYKGYWK